MDFQLGNIETKFADIIWENEPVSSTKLVELSKEQLGWKKSTTYTVLRRLCEKGLFKNENGAVTSLISSNEFHSQQCTQFVDDSFKGSLPAFFAAFTSGRNLSREEADEIHAMIDKFRKEK